MNAYLVGSDVLGEEIVIGLFDIQARRREMNTLKQVPITVASALLRGGMQAITQARSIATSKGLPGGAARDKVYGKLQWHDNTLRGIPPSPEIYASGSDLKEWVMQAFIEANAAEEGAAHIDAAWSAMWAEIQQELSKLPATIAKKVGEAGGGFIHAATGIPVWGWALIGVGTVGALAFFIWALANTRSGAAISHVAARRYIG